MVIEKQKNDRHPAFSGFDPSSVRD
jgi:hypothetical protein